MEKAKNSGKKVDFTTARRSRKWLRYVEIPVFQAAVGDKFGKRLIFTKKKMGAQTAEANDNAGVAAANQIVGFFEKGETRFSLKA